MAPLWLLFPYFALVSGADLQAYRLGSGPTGTEWSCECVVKDDSVGSCTTDDGLGRTHTLDLSEGYDGSLNFPVMEVYVIKDEYLGGGFKYVLFSPLFGEDSHFD